MSLHYSASEMFNAVYRKFIKNQHLFLSTILISKKCSIFFFIKFALVSVLARMCACAILYEPSQYSQNFGKFIEKNRPCFCPQSISGSMVMCRRYKIPKYSLSIIILEMSTPYFINLLLALLSHCESLYQFFFNNSLLFVLFCLP